MYRFKSIKYVACTSMITTILVVISYLSQFIKINNSSMLQLSDGLYFAIIVLIPGLGPLFAGICYVVIIDAITGYIAMVYVSILVRILMWVIITYTYRYFTIYVSFFLASLSLLFYVLFQWLLNYQAMAMAELITDCVQMAVAYFSGVILCIIIIKSNKNSNYRLWNDHEFDQYKKTSSKIKKGNE